MIKRSHLSEKKCREIIQLFSEDLTATQIAHITAVSRVTINNYLKLIRTHIAKFCEERNPKYHNRNIIPFVTMHIQRAPAEGESMDDVFNAHYGFLRQNGNIYVDWLQHVDKAAIQEMQRARLAGTDPAPSINGQDISKYQAIGDFDGWRLYRLDASAALNGRSQVDDISAFWGNTKSRLLKFRGLNKNTLYLHVKECEFRYNYRNDDINALLLNIIYKRPLHLSRTYN